VFVLEIQRLRKEYIREVEENIGAVGCFWLSWPSAGDETRKLSGKWWRASGRAINAAYGIVTMSFCEGEMVCV
jgi:hypothetical protein